MSSLPTSLAAVASCVALLAITIQNPAPTQGLLATVTTLVPVGSVLPWAGADDTPPPGYLFCDGQLLPEGAEYASLRKVLGQTYPRGGDSGVHLPNLRGGVIAAAGTNGKGKAVGHTEGDYTATLLTANIPRHTHLGTTGEGNGKGAVVNQAGSFSAPNHATGYAPGGNTPNANLPGMAHTHTFTTNHGDWQDPIAAVNITQPTIYMHYIIRYQ